MKIEALHRALEIQSQLERPEKARTEWENGMSCREALSWIGHRPKAMPEQMPSPIAAFRRACLDHIATEEAALNAEMEAL